MGDFFFFSTSRPRSYHLGSFPQTPQLFENILHMIILKELLFGLGFLEETVCH